MIRLRITQLALLALSLLGGAQAHAIMNMQPPFPCGTSYTVTQGHNTGSHTSNGSWAWDFGLPVGAMVTAAAPGTVIRARGDSTRGGCDSAYANDANYVVVDHGDGTAALYLHLQNVAVSVGQQVTTGQELGRVGLTGWVCGAHLHFQVQSVCNSWWCPSQPSTFAGYGDPGLGARLEGYCGGPTCPEGTWPIWTCEGDARRRCIDGDVQTEDCPNGCVSMPVGTDDVCNDPPAEDCDRSTSHPEVTLTFSCDGPNAGMTCVSVNEPDDPDSWSDNHLCSDRDVGLAWSHSGPIGGMRCTRVYEDSDDDAAAWSDNHLCLPPNTPFSLRWSVSGPIGGLSCVHWNEPSTLDESWGDNYLCIDTFTPEPESDAGVTDTTPPAQDTTTASNDTSAPTTDTGAPGTQDVASDGSPFDLGGGSPDDAAHGGDNPAEADGGGAASVKDACAVALSGGHGSGGVWVLLAAWLAVAVGRRR